jgi:hypothetical protein
MQVVRRRGRPEVAPEHVHHLLPVEAMAWSEGEQLYQLARLLQPPSRLRNRHAVDGGCEAAQQAEADFAQRPENDLLSAVLEEGARS